VAGRLAHADYRTDSDLDSDPADRVRAGRVIPAPRTLRWARMNPRALGTLAALAVALLAVGWQVRELHDDTSFLRPIDYPEYWAAGRATLDGRNPYDGEVLYALQRPMGNDTGAAQMMWNPPWTLPLTVLLGALPWRAGQLLWLALNLAAVVASAALLWRVFAGTWRRVGVAVAVAGAFAPTAFLLMIGQIGGFMLLGLAGFLFAVRFERFALAGCFGALTAIKPHLLAPFALVLALEALRGRPAWKSVLAGGAALLVCGVLPLAWNPDVWSQYREATGAGQAKSHHTLHDWEHPTLGYAIRTALPGQPFAAMFIPLAVTIPLVCAYWWGRRNAWDWPTELPRLVLVSVAAAPYGAWVFDLVLLLVPVVQATAWLAAEGRRNVILGAAALYATVNLLAFAATSEAGWTANRWLVPVTVAGYLLVGRICRGGANPRAAAASIQAEGQAECGLDDGTRLENGRGASP
jgi:hypothetical protein